MSERLTTTRENGPGTDQRPDATLQKLIEIISRSQQGYRELIDHLDQAVFTLSLKGEFLVGNRCLSEILGAPFQDFIGHPFTEFFDSPSLDDARRALPRLQDGAWRGVLPFHLKKQNRLHYFSCWFQPLIAGGELTGVIGYARDATAEHEAELRFAKLFDSLREGMFFAAPDGRLRDVNPALASMLGYSGKEDLRARNLRDLYADPAALDALLRDLASAYSVDERDIVLRHKSGDTVSCRGSAIAIRDESGRIAGIQGILADVTERLEIERRLHQEQEFVRRLIANFPDVIAVFDREARFTFVSQRINELLGVPPRDFIGMHALDRVHPEDVAKAQDALQQLLSGGAAHVQLELRLQHRDGTWRTMRASAGPLFEDDRISGIVASARDVTDSKRFEDHLSRTEKFAAMGQMLTGAAHELNNPLTAILGVGELLRDRASDDASRRHATIILNQARRAADIVQDLLAFSRPPTQGRVPFQLPEVVRQALNARREEFRAKNITVRFQAPDDLPSLEGDPKLLSQALLNIITNAEQAMSPARDSGTLDVSITHDGRQAVVTIADNGPGITPEDLQKIFDPFFTTKRPGGGTGLGLTISMVVAREHGGTVEVHSQPGAGATFRIVLPFPVRAKDAAPPASKAATGALGSLENRSVLVVDDEESIREIVEEGLRARGLLVDCAASVNAALSLLSGRAYDFVLCDLNLPGQRGSELFERLCGTPQQPALGFVFMTGDVIEPAKVEELSQRGAHVLNKPFQVSALAALLTQLLHLHPASH